VEGTSSMLSLSLSLSLRFECLLLCLSLRFLCFDGFLILLFWVSIFFGTGMPDEL